MRKVTARLISESVARLCVEANIHLRKDVAAALDEALLKETDKRAKTILKQLIENAKFAKLDKVALCQDTGMPIVFVDIGRDVDIRGIDMTAAINRGVADGYRRGYLRNSVIRNPLARGISVFTPCVIHSDFSKQKGLKLTVLPKGFGCENKTQLKMFNPTASIEEIENFIINAVVQAGPDACPPYILGIGIGGTADYACLLAKKALIKSVRSPKSAGHGAMAKLEKDLFKKINSLDIGPMGLGGRTTLLGVNILTYATHIAGLPVCVNVRCHVLRSASVLL